MSTTKVFAYLRVSGKSQVDGDGFPRQLQAVTAYAQSHGLTIVRTFRDEGVSGTKELENRPALTALFEALNADGVTTVVTERLDRLARDLMIQESLIQDFQRKGFEIISTLEPDLCSTDPTRILIRQILGAFAQYEKSMIVAKLRAARQRTGHFGGRTPFGTRTGEQATLDRMRALRTAGCSLEAVAATLDAEGHRTRYGTAWNAATICKILRANIECAA